MPDYTTKDWFGDGYTTYHEDGSTSYTSKDWFGDGYTTHHSDGSTSYTSKDWFGDGTTTYHSDGSTSHTSKDWFGDGYTTYHSDGSTSYTSKDWFGDGYTTYTTGGYGGVGGYASGGTSSYAPVSSYGYYGGGYYGGSSWNVGRIGVGYILLALAATAGVGYLMYEYMPAWSWLLGGLFLGCLVAGIVHRNAKKDKDCQDVWFVWTWTLADLVAIYAINAGMPVENSYDFAFAFYLFPWMFIIAMRLIINRSHNPLNDSMGADAAAIVGSAILLAVRVYMGWTGYLVGHDIIFAVLLVRALFVVKRYWKKATLPTFVGLPIVCYALYYTAAHVTLFYGFNMMWGWISSLLP